MTPQQPRTPARRPRRTVLADVADVPAELMQELIADMAVRMTGTPEARRTSGLSLSFHIDEVEMDPARYEVGRNGRVTVRHEDRGADFRFHAPAAIFDAVLLGEMSPVRAGLHGFRAIGNPLRLSGLMRMLPAVQRAYGDAREELIRRHSGRYDFRF